MRVSNRPLVILKCSSENNMIANMIAITQGNLPSMNLPHVKSGVIVISHSLMTKHFHQIVSYA